MGRVRPAAPNHLADLFVKGKILDVDRAGGLVDGARHPKYYPIAIHQHFA